MVSAKSAGLEYPDCHETCRHLTQVCQGAAAATGGAALYENLVRDQLSTAASTLETSDRHLPS